MKYLNADEIKRMVAIVESTLRTRNKNGSTACEADFLAGALTVLNQISGPDGLPGDLVPVMWALGPMSGRNVFDDCPPPKTRYQAEAEELVAAMRSDLIRYRDTHIRIKNMLDRGPSDDVGLDIIGRANDFLGNENK